MSFDLPAGAGETARIGDFVEDEQASDVSGEALRDREAQPLRLAPPRLPNPERHVLVGRYGLDARDPAAIADPSVKLGIPARRVSKLQRKAEQVLLANAAISHGAVA